MKNTLITIEGCDGAGKSTAINHALKYLQSKNIDSIKTREPGGSKIGNLFREIIVNENIQPLTEALSFAASRIEHIEQTIKPAFAKNQVVLCDRYFDSSIVYQGIARGLGVEKIQNYNSYAIKNFTPKLTIILDVDVDTALSRIKDNNRQTNRLDRESVKFHNKCRQGFKELIKIYPQRNIKYVDASKNEEEVKKDVIKLIDEVLNEKQ